MNEEMIRIRVSAADKSLFEDAAKALGLSLSAWVRMISIEQAKVVLAAHKPKIVKGRPK